jgi:thioredoxin reductase (NADPH)
MRAEGEIANLITSATIWRRIGIMGEATGGVTLLGHAGDPETTELQRFLVRNSYPHRVVEAPTEDPADPTVTGHDAEPHYPAIVLSDSRILHRPTIAQLADELGITELPDPNLIYDVIVVGAGPSGLAAAVYAASEGLCTIAIEGTAPGGQAGTSSKIENYLGFPTGISGQRLASRAQLQALKFGVRFAISREVVTAEQVDGVHKLTLAGGIPVCSRAVVIASGAQYRKLSVENYAHYENRGIYYAATAMESLLCRENEVIVVGGGNSAGQAAAFLSQTVGKVHMLVRSTQLSSTMSRYLIQRIDENPKIDVHYGTEIVALEGDAQLEQVIWKDKNKDERCAHKIRHVFVMTGGSPHTKWLQGCVVLDPKGFILTGRDLDPAVHEFTWPLSRTPQMFETSLPGVFAVGDVRSGNVKRVAAAVGEGSISIYLVHRVLAEL